MQEGQRVDNSSARAPTIIGAGFDTWGGSSFVQSRLLLLGKTVFCSQN